MSKVCYVVLNFSNTQVVKDVSRELFTTLIEYKNILQPANFAQYPTLKLAKEARRKSGGVILKAVDAI